MQQQAEFIQKFWKEQIKVSARYFSKNSDKIQMEYISEKCI